MSISWNRNRIANRAANGDRILELEERTKIQILAPLVSHRKGSHEKLIEDIGKRDMSDYVSMVK